MSRRIVCEDLEAANPSADAMMARYAEGLVEANYAGGGQDMAAQVRQLVVTLLGTGSCTIEVAAKHLGVTRRTIHRHLSNDGQTFSGIVEAVRRELATRYVAEKHRSLAEVSSLLGFSAPSGFSRWYTREFGSAASTRRARSSRQR
jgi:AraC-like DNA-binding protein